MKLLKNREGARGYSRKKIVLSQRELMIVCEVFGINQQAPDKALLELMRAMLMIESQTKDIVFPEIMVSRN